MKNAIIFHGTDEKPENYWYQWLKNELEKNEFEVNLPYYPDINQGSIENFLPQVLSSHSFNKDTVLIGHSSGAALILSILERIDARIKLAVLVAGYCETLPGREADDPILQKTYDWGKIKSQAKGWIFINSDNDPWGCDDKQGRKLFDRLSGTLVIRHDGHFGSTTHKQLYREFPLLKVLILGVNDE